MVSQTNPPPSIYSVQNEYANPTAPEPDAYVPTDDVYMALSQPSINSVQLPIPAGTKVNYQVVTAGPAPTNNFGQPLYQCPPNYVFVNGLCYPAGDFTTSVARQGNCQGNGDCPSGEICVDGYCTIISDTSINQIPLLTTDWAALAVLAAIVVVIVAFVLVFRK